MGKLKSRIRRLISDMHENTNVKTISDKLNQMYNKLDLNINVAEFQFPKQRDPKMKNFVIEISSKNETNINDLVTNYCKDRKIKVRPWKGKLPNSNLTKPTFI